jgi:DNA-binding GntR family transcriptional regulator
LSTVSDRIRELVLSGAVAPGAKLDEQALAERFEVSRTPVREALRELANTGLIDLLPRRGAFVAALTPPQIDELFAAMSELEATCARLAAMSMAPNERRDLQRLQETMAELAARELVEDFYKANEQLHSQILRGAHNSLLERMTGSLRDRRRPHRTTQFRSPGRLHESHAEHEVIVRAIVSGDPARAHAAMLHHLGRAGSAFQESLSSGASPILKGLEQ